MSSVRRTSAVVTPMALAGAWLLAAALGCGGKDDNRLDVYPVTGTITVKGKPVDGARIILNPIDEARRGPRMPLPTGTTGSDGKFQLTSYDLNDGAPEGEYQVAIVWPEPEKPTTPEAPEAAPVADRLKGRYGVPETSGLTAKVEAGPTELKSFDLP